MITSKNQHQLYEQCENLYSKKGQSAVFEFIQEHHPNQPWTECDPCETLSPHTIEQNSSCLVCGSLTSSKGDK